MKKKPAAQSDQRLCCSLPGYYNAPGFYIRNFKPLPIFCGAQPVCVLPGCKPRRQIFSSQGSTVILVRHCRSDLVEIGT